MSKTWVSLIAGLLIGMICLGLVILAIYLITPTTPRYSFVTPQITVIPAPSLAPIMDATSTLAPELLATFANIPPDPGGAIQAGMVVIISGTGGDGLRIRRDPGVNATPLFLGADNEEFVVKAGPETADGLTWWYIEAPFDSKRQGWAAANYLTPNQQP